MKMNKKGFTLVELLAVIVILAIVMLVGVTAVGPVMEKTRKTAIIDEGATIINSAMLAYESDQAFTETTIVLDENMDIDELGSYYTKKDSSYSGWVKLTQEDDNTIIAEYCLYNSNTKYGISSGNLSSTVADVAKTDTNPCSTE